jgi:hypothetical protein
MIMREMTKKTYLNESSIRSVARELIVLPTHIVSLVSNKRLVHHVDECCLTNLRKDINE